MALIALDEGIGYHALVVKPVRVFQRFHATLHIQSSALVEVGSVGAGRNIEVKMECNLV